jgi:hypothetical protein
MKYLKGFGCAVGAIIVLGAGISGLMWLIEHHPLSAVIIWTLGVVIGATWAFADFFEEKR